MDNTVWYSYTAASSGDLLIDTEGSDFDTVLHVYQDNGGSLSLVDCNDDDPTGYGTTSRLMASITSGNTYLISVGGFDGDYGMLNIEIDAIGAFTSCSAVDVPAAECNALMNLYNNNNGANWYSRGGWFSNESVCTWDGIGCWSGHVDTISLSYNNLSGPLATNFTNLPYLWNLDLSGNQLSGNWATIIGNLPTDIGYLYLDGNQFTGTFPSMSSFSYLYGLGLGDSGLTGDLSTFIGKLPATVEYLNLYGNQFTGTVPSMSTFSNLYLLNLSDNGLTGNLSTAIGNLPTGIRYLYLAWNGFTGTVPSSIGSFTNLWMLDLGGNNLTGDLPTIIGYLPTGIGSLKLGWNGFTGTVPSSIGSFTDLWALDLSGNNLTGDLSTIIGYLNTGLSDLYLDGNNFTGTIPSSISNFTSLNTFYIDNNTALNGTVPIEITNLDLGYFDFHNTNLCAPESSAYGNWAMSLNYYDPNSCNPPTGAFTAPTAGGSLMIPRTWLSVNASDSNGEVKSVEFWAYYDSSWHYLGTDTNGADGWAYQWNTSNIAEQTVEVWADIFDNVADRSSISLNNISLSDTITFGNGYESRGSGSVDEEIAQPEICEVEPLEGLNEPLIDTLNIFEPLFDSDTHIQPPH